MKKIVISGKTYPCRVTMGAMLRFKHETGYDVNKLKADEIAEQVVFLWCCTASACNADGVSFDMSLEDFADQLDPDQLQLLSDSEDDDSKKKAEMK